MPHTTLRRLLTAAALTFGLPIAAVPPSPAVAAPAASIRWSACAQPEFAAAQCGTVRVPVDWSKPRGATVALSLVRRPADDRAHRIGTLMLNDGAGGSSIEQLRLALRADLPGNAGAMTQRFDLVALDPRGVGHSTPIRCRTPIKAAGVTRFPADRAAYDRLVADNRAFADDCRRRNGSLVDHLDLTSTARDFEAVRVALGERRLDWYGIHYSTLLGRTYAALFPGRLRTMTLDTALDDTVPLVSRIAAEAATAESAFDRFTAWCRATATCALHGRDVAADYDALVARANAHPMPVPGGNHPPVTGEDIQAATQDYLNISFLYWPMLATAIIHPTDFATDPDDTLDPVQLQVTACADTSATATYDQLAGLQRMVRQISPHLGGAVRSWNALTGCLGRPTRPAPATPPITHAPSTLVVQSTHQALAPYAAGFSLAAQLPGSVVLSREGDDYSMFLLSGCVRDHVNRNLTDRKLPAPGTTCTD